MPLHPPSLRSSILSLRSAFPHFLQKILVFKFQSFFPWLLCSKFCFTFWLRDPEPEKLFNFLKTDGCSVPFPHSHATTPTTGKPLTNLLAVNPLCGRVCVCGGRGKGWVKGHIISPHTPHPTPPSPTPTSLSSLLTVTTCHFHSPLYTLHSPPSKLPPPHSTTHNYPPSNLPPIHK